MLPPLSTNLPLSMTQTAPPLKPMALPLTTPPCCSFLAAESMMVSVPAMTSNTLPPITSVVAPTPRPRLRSMVLPLRSMPKSEASTSSVESPRMAFTVPASTSVPAREGESILSLSLLHLDLHCAVTSVLARIATGVPSARPFFAALGSAFAGLLMATPPMETRQPSKS